jgi:hypothetical protein
LLLLPVASVVEQRASCKHGKADSLTQQQ